MYFKKSFFIVPLFLILSVGVAPAEARVAPTSEHHLAMRRELIDPAAFQVSMRKLWEQHVVLTRLFLVSSTQGFGDRDLVLQALLANQMDLGNSIKVFYGNDAGDQLTSLLTNHIKFAGEIVGDLMANKSAEATIVMTAWYANSDDIASFLNKANPMNWPIADLQAMLRTHLDLTAAEVKDEVSKSYENSAADFIQIQSEMVNMADTLSSGIITQFPDLFKQSP